LLYDVFRHTVIPPTRARPDLAVVMLDSTQVVVAAVAALIFFRLVDFIQPESGREKTM
jgi:hypothetical protein